MSAVEIPVKENKEDFFWKLKNGSLKPISQMTDDEIIKFRKICLKKNKMHYHLFEKFSDFVEVFDKALNERIAVKKESLDKLVKAEKE